MENNLENAKKYFEENNMECFTPQEMNVIGKTMRDYSAKVIRPITAEKRKELVKLCEDFTVSSEAGQSLFDHVIRLFS